MTLEWAIFLFCLNLILYFLIFTNNYFACLRTTFSLLPTAALKLLQYPVFSLAWSVLILAKIFGNKETLYNSFTYSIPSAYMITIFVPRFHFLLFWFYCQVTSGILEIAHEAEALRLIWPGHCLWLGVLTPGGIKLVGLGNSAAYAKGEQEVFLFPGPTLLQNTIDLWCYLSFEICHFFFFQIEEARVEGNPR